jgi:uncharacterized membrane protein
MSFAPALPLSWLVLLGAVALGVTLASARMARRLSAGARLVTTVLRLAVLALVLLVLANPVQRGETLLPAPGAWQAVLLDTSASMSLGGESPRWREALEWSGPILAGQAKGVSARLVTFDSATNLAPDTPAEARGTASHLGQAIERVVEQAGDTPPTQIVVVSDGIFDDAEQITAAIAKARSRRTVVSTHVVGRDEVLANLAFKRFRAPRFADPNSRVAITCDIAATGFPPTTPLTVTLRREDGSIAAQDSWTLGENTKPREIQLPVGERAGHFTAQLEAVAGEVTEADNALSFRIDLSDPKIRVLYGEGSQSLFEVGTDMMNALQLISTALRRAGDIECDVFAPQEQDAPGLPIYYVRGYNEAKETVLDFSRSLPADRAGWMQYDVVIISDIDRRSFSAAQMEWVRQLVTERGGGFAMFGGNWGFDTGNYDKTLWEKLIPVDCLEFGFGHAWRPTPPIFPAALRHHPILRIVEDEATNNAILDSHPALGGYHDIRRAKPGAVVLGKVDGSESPLIAIQEYARGRTMAFLSDPAGGWGDHGYQGFWGPGMLAEYLGANPPDAARAIIEDTSLAANEFYNRFWVNAVRWLGATSVRRQHRDLLGRSEVAIARPGEKLAVSADVRAGIPTEELANWSVGARLDGAGNARVALQFDRQRREFVGEVAVPADLASSDLKVVFDAVSGGAAFTDVVTLPVVRMAGEFERTAPDPRLMADIAQAGGGRVLNTAAEAAEVFAAARQTTAEAHVSYAQPLWDRTWLWLLVVSLLTAEWWLRRKARDIAVPVAKPSREFVAVRVLPMAAALLFLPHASAADPVTKVARVCLIFGNPGDEIHRKVHAKLRTQLERTFRERFGVPGDSLVIFNADPAAPDAPPVARDHLLALVKDAAASAQADAATWLIFIGHANATRTGANFQVPGTDVTETDLRQALDAAHPAGPVVILFTTSSSGRLVRSLAGPNRFIFAATRPSDADNETELPAVLATALNAPATDADGDGVVSLLELFQACTSGVRREYSSQGLVQVEMPGLDGNGDGRATQRPTPEDAEPATRIGLKLPPPQR